MSRHPFVCPQCGSESLSVSASPPTLEDFYNSRCADCGHEMSEEKIKSQARIIAEKTLSEILSKQRKR
jgi:predicted Zn-ribbon and HTH transcriptional regulator